jgi:Protein of unknown function (DUF3572)
MTIRRKAPTNRSRSDKSKNKSRRDGAAGNELGSAQRQAAEELAIAALGFIAAEPERLGRFLAETGIGPDSIRDAAREPRFLAGVLDHIAANESLLLAFATEYEVDPDALMRARGVLAGRHWERDTP